MRLRRIILTIIALLALAAGGFVWASQHPVIAGIEPPPRAAFDKALIDTGAKLAAIGNCRSCHTVPGKADFAGGRAIRTPYGTIYSSNISPAPGTGIGRWPEEAFTRAMRRGVSRRGQHLLPAFPYDHFTRLSDGDIHALYAFMMTRVPVENFVPANKFPLNQRWLVPIWNALFLREAPFQADPKHDDEWNRGAYLVSSLGHCGACHTPRNLLGAEKTGYALAGGEADGWTAPALNAASPAPAPWDAESLYTYLRQGWEASHGAAAGPMQPVTENLVHADTADVRAIATYIAAQQEKSSQRRRGGETPANSSGSSQAGKPAQGDGMGAAIFAGACANCHSAAPDAATAAHAIDLSLSTALHENDPRNAILTVLEGIHPGPEQAGPWMPRFENAFTDTQLSALLNYLRVQYGSGAAWPGLEGKIREVRNNKERS
jgi:mono/diheme cytochrome c family protein